MKGCFLIIAFLMLSSVSFAQRRKVDEKMNPVAVKKIDVSFRLNEVVIGCEYLNYIAEKKDVCEAQTYRYCSPISCPPQFDKPNESPSLDHIIYLNDLLYKRPDNYFPGK